MLRAYKFRLYPTDNQKTLINKTFGCTRYIYNHFLDMQQKLYKETKKSKTSYDLCKEIKIISKEKEWLSEVDSCALRCAIFDLEDAFKNFFKKTGKYPNFKHKYGKNSYRTNCIRSEYKGNSYENIKVDLKNKTITLPKLREIKIRGYRNLVSLNGRIINATISKDSSNRYYVSVIVEEPTIITKNNSQSIIGIDLGIASLVTTSEGETIQNPKALSKYGQRIKRIQRDLARKQKGSKNYYKCREKLAIVFRKVRNTRKYYLHQISKAITDTHKVIVAETLKIKNMLKNHKLSKSITDSSWYELIRQIGYKSRYKDCKFYQIEPSYASSQLCNVCEYKNEEVKNLKIRKWECEVCGSKHNRDINAAINIMGKGLERYVLELV